MQKESVAGIAAVELLKDPERIIRLEENAGKMALTEAAQVICDEAYKLV